MLTRLQHGGTFQIQFMLCMYDMANQWQVGVASRARCALSDISYVGYVPSLQSLIDINKIEYSIQLSHLVLVHVPAWYQVLHCTL